MEKAQKGDLIRIVEADDTRYKNGDIFEVVDDFDSEGVFVNTPDDSNVLVYDEEYVIHRKAGEEEDVDSTQEPSKWSDTQPNLIRLAGEELTDLLVRKNHDYGDSFSQQYAKYGALSAMIRMDDKMRRLETLLGGEQAQVDESLADTLLDLSGYALLAYVETQKK